MNEIEFIQEVKLQVKNWVSIKEWIISCVADENKTVGCLSYVFMTDEALLVFNKEYLNHDFYTDVITFDDSDFPMINGDILVSVDRIKDNSNQLKTNYKEEFLRVIIHGVLHLCGYKDKVPNDELVMREKERFYLEKVAFEL